MKFLEFKEPVDLSEHMLATYQILRVLLVVVALAFPWLLGIGGKIRDDLKLQDALSDYYHANKASAAEFATREPGECTERGPLPLKPGQCVDSGRGVMRNWFVGVLFAVAALLVVYKGFRPAENVALNLAGLFAVLTAIFPNAWDQEDSSKLHGIFAFLFFACIAYVCLFCASATLSLVEDEKKRARYRRMYKLVGCAMLVSPAVAIFVSWVLNLHNAVLFFIEAFGVYAFAVYWMVKTHEIRKTQADQKAAEGKLQLEAGKGPRDAVRQLQVQSKEPNAGPTGQDKAK